MEKTTKKRKKSKRAKKRIGLLVVGGLSLVLTVCLSVGATLAWFAGSTWASNDLYMGGPVYVEMAGRGENAYGAADGAHNDATLDNAVWKGGAGTLDIIASGRKTGTSGDKDANGNVDSQILLPGQKLLIYSQARVFSTLTSSNVNDGKGPDASSGSNNSNVSDGTHSYYNGKGTRHTATTSVLRAKFSIDIQFDPSVGFNNFTDATYVAGYPKQSSNYIGDVGSDVDPDVPAVTGSTPAPAQYYWSSALGATPYSHTRTWNETTKRYEVLDEDKSGRRDAVTTGNWVDGTVDGDLQKVKDGTHKLIYKWQYVSHDEYFKASNANARMDAPFNGTVNSAGDPSNTKADGTANTSGNGNGYYGLYVLDGSGNKTESDAFYKARTEAYMSSYIEHYIDNYNRDLVLKIGTSLNKLENSLNDSFVDLVNASSDRILTGYVNGFEADTSGSLTYDTASAGVPATWLYVDPTLGNDTNAGDSSSSVGGWWYLVESANTSTVSKIKGDDTSGNNEVATIIDNVTGVTTLTDGIVSYAYASQTTASKNVPLSSKTTTKTTADVGALPSFKRAATSKDDHTELADDDPRILNAKLYEIVPNFEDRQMSTNPVNGKTTTKVVSVAFPFVNGNFELPGKELTNVFANARITFKITFQALQAFFPFSNSIDGLASGSALAGTGKALNIGNAIPIYNEAFDYLAYLDTGDTAWPVSGS